VAPAADGGTVRRVRIAGALLVAILVSVLFRTGDLDAGFWIDEGIAVGIASHPLADIPALLRADGSPPLYYLLLHGWLALTGGGEAAARSLSLLFGAVTVPASWWAADAVAGRRAAVAAAAIAVGCPLLSYYAQEARMYTLVALLSVVVSAAFVLAFVRGRRRHLVTLGVALVLLLYTHNWGVFLAAALAVAWLALWRAGRVAGRDGALLAAAARARRAPGCWRSWRLPGWRSAGLRRSSSRPGRCATYWCSTALSSCRWRAASRVIPSWSWAPPRCSWPRRCPPGATCAPSRSARASGSGPATWWSPPSPSRCPCCSFTSPPHSCT
jgi:hypothetical protein